LNKFVEVEQYEVEVDGSLYYLKQIQKLAMDNNFLTLLTNQYSSGGQIKH
jgi:hypothetical protein